mmetsp:Transcript_114315/g.202613  ORF Transcript_114315/g.202613 Transcript_114315/m.202613 type:complete len:113 (-) Transcript_114315:66-404(-)
MSRSFLLAFLHLLSSIAFIQGRVLQGSSVKDEGETSMAASMMDGFDTNKDGKISLQELEEKIGAKGGPAAGAFKGWQTGFNEADADSDGYLTADELASWFQLISEKPKHDEM